MTTLTQATPKPEAGPTASSRRNKAAHLKYDTITDRKGRPILVRTLTRVPDPNNMRTPTGCREIARNTTAPGSAARRQALSECNA